MPTTNDPTPKTSTKGGYYGNSVGNINEAAANDHLTSPLKNNSSNPLSTAAITTTTDDPTPSTSTEGGYYVKGDCYCICLCCI